MVRDRRDAQPLPQVPAEQVSIPWFRWKLLGDNAACKFFKAMPNNSAIVRAGPRDVGERETLPIERRLRGRPPRMAEVRGTWIAAALGQ